MLRHGGRQFFPFLFPSHSLSIVSHIYHPYVPFSIPSKPFLYDYSHDLILRRQHKSLHKLPFDIFIFHKLCPPLLDHISYRTQL